MESVDMPLTELMNYFNDQLQTQARTKSLPKTGFYKADNVYWARFGSLILGSDFHPIDSLKEEKTLGYEAELIVRASTGNLLNIDSIFNSLDSTEQIVHLDRLVRTLHSLNYLQQYDGQDYLLSLQVQSRHIVSVSEDHGKAFEAILSDCGLTPERVLLHTRLLDHATLKHFKKALDSYQSRGYKIGINITQSRELTLLANLGVVPDVIFAHYPSLPLDVKSGRVSNDQVFLIPVEFYAGQRILVSESRGLIDHLSDSFDGLLISPQSSADDTQSVSYFTG
ncbi:MAG: EAL domain-containing protein [Sphingobacteriales bacterium]|nr:MAG: EAL domain-containing protein [Sphingobacteriales bacterium]